LVQGGSIPPAPTNEHETTAHHGWSRTVQRFSFEASPVMGRMGKQYRAEDA